MRKIVLVSGLSLFCLFIVSCSGIKVINSNDQNPNQGTLALDASGGQFKVVSTYTCKLESMGKRFTALGKTEEDARKEVVAKCRDASVLSFCKPEKVSCLKN